MSQRKGEGSYDGAEKFQREQHEFAKSGKVEQKAAKAAAALDGEAAEELAQAEKAAAKARAH